MLPSITIAKEFVKEAGKCDFDINVFYNRIVIDAKSLLGVLSPVSYTHLLYFIWYQYFYVFLFYSS